MHVGSGFFAQYYANIIHLGYWKICCFAASITGRITRIMNKYTPRCCLTSTQSQTKRCATWMNDELKESISNQKTMELEIANDAKKNPKGFFKYVNQKPETKTVLQNIRRDDRLIPD